MISTLRYQLAVAVRARAPLFPLIATLFVVIGVFAGGYNPVGDTWGLTGILVAGLACWLTVAIVGSEPPVQAEMATVACGGHAARLQAQLLLVSLQAVMLGLVFVAYPLLLDHVVAQPVFIRPVRSGDVIAAVLTNVTGAVLGGVIGLCCSPPRIRRPPVSAGTALGLLLALVAISQALGELGGPPAAASAMTHAHAGSISFDEPIAWSSTLVFAVMFYGVCHYRTVRGTTPATRGPKHPV